MPRGPEQADAGKSAAMANQRQRDTAVELSVRRELHRRGLRYRLQQRIVPGASRRLVDIVLPRPKIAVDCRECWWHGCPHHGALPGRNRTWWASKLESNSARDADTEHRLTTAGWAVVIVWEHDDPVQVAERIATYVAKRAPRSISAKTRL